MTTVKRAYGFADVLGAVDGGGRFAVDVHRAGIFRTNSVAPQSDDVPLRTVVWSWDDAPADVGVEPDAVLTLAESVRWDRRDPAAEFTGIKQVCFVARRSDVPRAEFERRYAAHADIARVHHPAVSRYVQNLVVDARGADAGAIEAISELWFDTVDDYREHYYAGPDSPDVVRTDVVDYLDFTRGFNVMMETRAR
ncbi:hypothetical protein C8K36_10210 [Rhodococcus sp. OK519]|uniref:hypothetical protein n=1 Tax=Rhodococcus sp. OK519 TaxID=2135729 RepID=UPI000D34D854|nr:hypothetical protein C8K36_10210 [Rhodococcus sp. OK519]